MLDSTSPTAANLAGLLAECAANAPASFRDQRQSWGFTSAGKIIAEAKATGLATNVDGVLEQFLKSTDPDEVWLALVFLPLPRAIALGMQHLDQSQWYDNVSEEWRALLGRAVSQGLVPYDPSMRALRPHPGGRSFVASIIAYDNAWFWSNVDTVLGKKAADVEFELLLALRELSQSEAHKLRAALPHGLAPDVVTAFENAITKYDTSGAYERTGSDRF